MAYRGNNGQLIKPELSERNFKHGLRHDRYYRLWSSIKNRCHNPCNESYRLYGSRGIVMCDEWRYNPKAFIEWCWANKLDDGIKQSIDRFPDTNGPYSPTNCRFATDKQQTRNKRSNIWIEHNGEKLIFADFVTKYSKVKKGVVKTRIKKGWGRHEAVLTPLLPRNRIWVEYNGERLNRKEFIAKYGKVSGSHTRHRMRKYGWDIITAATTPKFE